MELWATEVGFGRPASKKGKEAQNERQFQAK